MKKQFKGFARWLLYGMLVMCSVSANASYVISVYREGGSAQQFSFNDSGDEISCTVTLSGFTGNTSDYKYWIGNGNWDDKSCNFNLGSSNSGNCDATVSGSDYLSSCSTGSFKVYIYKSSGDKNYYPHGMTCVDTSSCTVQSKGNAIPANTMIFFDNSAGIFSNEIWVSVPTESGNGNSTSLDQGSYHRNKDKWYRMVNIEGNIWQATITEASSYGRMSFWNKDGSASDDVWQNTVVFQVPYKTGKNVVIPDASKKCRNDNRESDYYTNTTLDTRTGVSLSSSIYEMKSTDINPITLTAVPVGVTGTTYKFEKRPFDSEVWTTIATQTQESLLLSGALLPTKSTYYRVTYGGVTSEEIRISVLVDCQDGGSAKNIFKIDFGTISELSGLNSRKESGDIYKPSEDSKKYTYRPYPQLVDDGDYAIVATPYHCGCGKGKSDGCDHCHDVDVDCLDGTGAINYWFRDIKDHTVGDAGVSGSYGAMLFINFSDQKSKIAYEHVLTADEKSSFVKGSTLSFSAYFASAAKREATKVMINMALKIQYKSAGSSTWNTMAILENKVKFDDNWKYGNTSIDIDDPAGDYRVIIENYGQAGEGNDALIDDISLDLCVPTFPVDYYDYSKDSVYRDYSFNHVTEEQTVRILKQDYGHGEENCVLLLQVDQSYPIGQAGRYLVLKSMSKETIKGLDYYTVNVNPMELTNGLPGEGNLQVVVVDHSYCSDESKFQALKEKIEDGTIKPLDSSDYLFSTNLLSYDLTCKEKIIASVDGNTDVCVEEGKKTDDLPVINVTFEHITDLVFYTLMEDEQFIVSDVQLTDEQLAAGSFSINLNEVSGVIRTEGTHNFTVVIYERSSLTTGNKFCAKTSNAVSLTMHQKPTYTQLPLTVTKCDGVAKTISVTASNVKGYFWQVKKNPNDSWETADGVYYKASYSIPAEAETGWMYRVGMTSAYCTTVYSNVITVNSERCEAVSLTLTPNKTSICKGEEVEFTVSVKNMGSLVTDINITEDVSLLNDLVFVSASPSKGSYANNVWSISDLATEESATLVLVYQARVNTFTSATEKVYVSKLVAVTWNSYDEQTDENMKQSTVVVASSVTEAPVVASAYNECRTEGTKELADLVQSDKTELKWYSDANLTTLVSPATFDMNTVVADKKYYVTNTEAGKCVSEASEASVTVRENPVAPLTTNYKECPSDEMLNLQSLVTNYDTKYTYSYFQGVITLNDGMVDVSQPSNVDYSVMATLDGCESAKATMNVVVKNQAVMSDISVEDQEVCKGTEATMTASSASVQPNPVFTWYKDAELSEKLATGATYSVKVDEDVTYYVTVQNDDYCENLSGDGAEVSLGTKIPVSGITLKENASNVGPALTEDKVDTEEMVNGVPTYIVALGGKTDKILTVEPLVSADKYTVKWYANDSEFDGEFPRQPYIDQVYKVVVVDECGVSHEAKAATNVIWPTVITPQVVDGFNDDFVVGMDKPFAIKVFDRTGNMMYEGSDGWPNESAIRCMPGVYYYRVVLPDDMGIKKGTVEIYKAK